MSTKGPEAVAIRPAMRTSAYLSFIVVSFLLMFGGVAECGGPTTCARTRRHRIQQSRRIGPAASGPGEKPAGPIKAHKELALPRVQSQGAEASAPEAPEHGAAHGEAHVGPRGEEHVQLPEISPIPGVTFVDTLIKLMDYELHGRMLGWRPNGIMICRFTDNINNYQLGVLEAVRFTTLRLKDSLTRLGEADTYDPDLEQAVNELHDQRHFMVVPIR